MVHGYVCSTIFSLLVENMTVLLFIPNTGSEVSEPQNLYSMRVESVHGIGLLPGTVTLNFFTSYQPTTGQQGACFFITYQQ